ncbi:hypothetical protein PanABDRAFT_0504 [Pantoea sp. aB]|jgi:hypothetical protein|nr:hypothetical protein PanABDRAFT_0504 [Pantoea sp. aB]
MVHFRALIDNIASSSITELVKKHAKAGLVKLAQ